MSLFSFSLWTMAAVLGVAVLIGGLIGWLAGGASARRAAGEALRAQADEARAALDQARAQALQMARADAEGALRPLLATAEERARGLEAEREVLRANLSASQLQVQQWRDALDAASNESAQLAERAARLPALLAELEQLRGQHAAARDQIGTLRAELAQVQARIESEREEAARLAALSQAAAAEKIALLQEARESLGNQFKALANDILEDKSKRFAEQNQASLGSLLEPLRLRLSDFQQRVDSYYDAEGKQRSALSEQVRQLAALNQAMSADARNLTSALKGSSKTQGNWGELILERVLEASGLRRDLHYHVQASHTREDGTRAQPDVVIDLPGERKLVVDAKVSLLAYEAFVSADDEELRRAAQKRHVQSLRAHIEGLSRKRYEDLYGLKSLDFVLMFVPIEPAFMLAISADEQLFMDAWERNVLLVSPSTLLFVVRTVAHLWRQEDQGRNAQQIAERGRALYDKLADFVKDLEGVGGSLKAAQGAYDKAYNKLAGGKGNAIRQAQMLIELGVKSDKSFSAAALELSRGEDGALPAPPDVPQEAPDDPPVADAADLASGTLQK